MTIIRFAYDVIRVFVALCIGIAIGGGLAAIAAMIGRGI